MGGLLSSSALFVLFNILLIQSETEAVMRFKRDDGSMSHAFQSYAFPNDEDDEAFEVGHSRDKRSPEPLPDWVKMETDGSGIPKKRRKGKKRFFDQPGSTPPPGVTTENPNDEDEGIEMWRNLAMEAPPLPGQPPPAPLLVKKGDVVQMEPDKTYFFTMVDRDKEGNIEQTVGMSVRNQVYTCTSCH